MNTLIAPTQHSNRIDRITIRSRFDLTTVLTLIACHAISMVGWTSHCSAQTHVHPYLTSNAISLTQRLQAPCDQRVANAPLGETLELIAKQYDVPIWFDRRVAIDSLVTIKTATSSFEDFIEQIASQANASLVSVDNVLMIVPSDRRDAIEKAYWDLYLADKKNQWTVPDKKSFEWATATTPSEIASRLFSRPSWVDASTVKLEHDLWRAWQFKNTSPAAMSICLLSGFDQTVTLESNQWVVRSLNIEPNTSNDVAWNYESEIPKIGEQRWKSWRQEWPNVVITKLPKTAVSNRNVFQIKGPPAAHRALIASLIPPKKWVTPPNAQKVYSGQLRGDLASALQSLSNQNNLVFTPNPLPPELAGKEINIEFDKATVDVILTMIGKQASVEFRRKGNDIEVIRLDR